METYEQYLGKQMNFNGTDFAKSVAGYNKHLRPALIELQEAYEALDLGELTQDIFDSLRTGKGIESLREKCVQKCNKKVGELDVSKISENIERLNAIPGKIATLKSKAEQLNEAFREAQGYNGGEGVQLQWNLIKIVDGNPFLEEKEMKELFTTRIKTEIQARLYEKVLEIVTAQNAVLNLIKSSDVKGPAVEHLFSLHERILFSVSGDGSLSVAEGAPFLIDRLKSMKMMQEASVRNQQVIADRQREVLYPKVTHDLNGRAYEEGEPSLDEKLQGEIEYKRRTANRPQPF